MNSLRIKIGREIKSIREELGLTQYQFADRYNATKDATMREINQKDISRYEHGAVSIPAEIFEHMKSLKEEKEYEPIYVGEY